VPTVTIDGRKVEVEKDATILDAAKKAGIWIPTLCYHPAILRDASCRLCMVELDRGPAPIEPASAQPTGGKVKLSAEGQSVRGRQLVTACNYPVRRDIVVHVESDRAKQARQGVMELLLARAPESQELKALAERMGVVKTHYPTVTESQRNCILCGLCVRVCEQVIGRAAIGFAGRGAERTVAAPFRQPSEDCIGCGACAAVCPVGTIKVRIHQDTQEVEISPFKSRAKLLLCQECKRPIVSTQVSEQVLSCGKVNWEEFRQRLRLCPKCRRLKIAGSVQRIAYSE